MVIKINSNRLKIARTRRKMTLKALSEKTNLTTRIISSYENDSCDYVPKAETLKALSDALNYPVSFLTDREYVEQISSDSVSFRSLKSMRAKDEQAAISAGSLGVMLYEYFESKVNFIPTPNIPDLRGMSPQSAAQFIREFWDIGSLSITNVIHLLERNGVRVLTLAENTVSVDAFSFWNENTPYVFLNTQKSGERSRFDAAHELGHLLLHKHGSPQGRDAEKEADEFAANFLMPRSTILPFRGKIFSINEIIEYKSRWKVSAMGLIVHSKNVGILSEWQYRNLIIEASKLGLRKKEIDGIEHEKSGLIPVIMKDLQGSASSDIKFIADDLNLPISEVSNLLFGVASLSSENSKHSSKSKANLRLVK
ncbi:helix-turn-helix domain-containing protein [Bacterioplanoides sp.]|uniref:helix-turn-helix domain-containing protein n=1 Tax=Bacterioplanoides sp. TaxID=2066072 RepID=UPI003B598BBB